MNRDRSTTWWSSSQEAKFNGEIRPTLMDLVDRGIVRVLDLLLIKKQADDTFETFELGEVDTGELGELRRLEAPDGRGAERRGRGQRCRRS